MTTLHFTLRDQQDAARRMIGGLIAEVEATHRIHREGKGTEDQRAALGARVRAYAAAVIGAQDDAGVSSDAARALFAGLADLAAGPKTSTTSAAIFRTVDRVCAA